MRYILFLSYSLLGTTRWILLIHLHLGINIREQLIIKSIEKYLNEIHNRFVKNEKETKLKYQSIDSAFITSKRGSIRNKDNNNLLNANAKKIKKLK